MFQWKWWQYIKVSKIGGIPKWMFNEGKSIYKWMIWGYPHDLGHPHMTSHRSPCGPGPELFVFKQLHGLSGWGATVFQRVMRVSERNAWFISWKIPSKSPNMGVYRYIILENGWFLGELDRKIWMTGVGLWKQKPPCSRHGSACRCCQIRLAKLSEASGQWSQASDLSSLMGLPQ